jgi:aminopeptidase N
MNFATASNPNFDDTKFTDYFVDKTEIKKISFPSNFNPNQDWFIFNKQQLGYYRVNYDLSNWQKIIKVLNSENFNQIHVLNRAQLIDDAMNFAADGYLSYSIAMNVLSYLNRETDYAPFKAAINNLEKLDSLLTGRESHKEFKTFIKLTMKTIYDKFGFEEKSDDSLMEKLTREIAIDWMCQMENENCLTETYSRLKKMIFDGENVPASIQISVFCNGLKGTNKQNEFRELFKKMQKSNDQAERLRIIDGLMCSNDAEMLLELLKSTLNDDFETNYKTHERTRILNNIFNRSANGLNVLVDFIDEFYDQIVSM